MDALPGGNRWPVLLATRAYGQLRTLERDQKVLGTVHDKIKELSSGDFNWDNHRPVIGSTKDIPMYRAKLPFDLRIIYQISVEPDVHNSYDRQAIKILRIESRAHVDYQFWVKVSRHLAISKGPEYRRRCVYRWYSGLPAKFPCADYRNTEKSDCVEYEDVRNEEVTERDQEELQSTVGLERYVPFSKAVYNAIVADLDVDLPMLLDTHERAIVNCTNASIVVGRSGTGKTTALIYKMRAVNQSAISGGSTRPVRQLFVTRSRVLAQHVESTFRGLARSAEIASKTRAELEEMAEEARQRPNQALAEFDNEIDLREDLPGSFSALDDSHFPLFISFDKLCTLLEGDLSNQTEVKPKKTITQHKRVEFNEFREKYWPRFTRRLTSGLDPALVYSEIVAVIKGSSEALESANGYLSRHYYMECLPRRVLSRLPGPTRDVVYSIFEQYQRQKGKNFEWDHADRTRQILKYFGPKGTARLVDYLYVDEVQDNLMLDIHLLRSLCPDIQGTYWGGDTAQTVVAGSAFRIKDLKSFVYQDIAHQSTRDNRQTWESPGSSFSTFDLTVNFRSHSGIVNCAASIVEIVYRLFPDSIDKMPTETAIVDGPPPILFTDSRDDLAFFEEFVLGSNPGARTGFGAQQAILVRSDAVAEELDSQLDGLCPILTIAESKGLEFDDVMIYNFFNHSSASHGDWQYVSGPPTHRRSYDPLVAPPVLCIELKMLYVAITRARRRCWIWDSGKTLDGMKEYLLSRGLITTASTSEMIGRIGVNSTNAQWMAKGQEYFSCGLYKIAAACFNHADRPEEARTASAYHQMSRAKLKHLRCDNDSSRDALIKAADSMKQCAAQATGLNARHYWFHVASCLQLAREFVPASDALVEIGHYTEAVELLFENDQYDYGTTLLLRHEHRMELQTRDSLLDRSRNHYFEARDYAALPRVFRSGLDAQLAYAREHGYRPQLKYLLKTHEKFDDLAALYIEEGSIPTGVEYFLTAYRMHGGTSRLNDATNATIDYAETILLLEGQFRELARKDLLRAITLVTPHLGEVSEQMQRRVQFFHVLLTVEHVGLNLARTRNPDIPSENAERMLALYIALTDPSWPKTDSSNVLIEHFYGWSDYIAGVQQMANDPNSSCSETVQLLLGLRPAGLDHRAVSRMIIFEDSLVLAAARRENWAITSGGTGKYYLLTTTVNRIIQSGLAVRLRDRQLTLHSNMLKSPLTRSYYGARPFGSSLGAAARTGFKQRLQIVTWVMCYLTPLVESPPSESVQHNVARKWVRRLHDLVYPLNGFEEDISLISSVPALPKEEYPICHAVLQYLPAAVTELEDNSPRPIDFFATLVSVLALAALLDRQKLDRYASEEHPFHQYPGLMELDDSGRGDLLAMDFVEFFRAECPDSLTNIVSTLEYILDSNTDMDAAIMVHVIELVTREMIFSLRAAESSTGDGFAGLLLPRSWAKSLIKTQVPLKPGRETGERDSLVRILARLSTELKFGNRRKWTVDGSRPYKDVLHMLNLRLCWCVSLFVLNVTPDHDSVFSTLRTLRSIANNTKPPHFTHRHTADKTPYDVFSEVSDHSACLETLHQTLRHERLVLLLGEVEDLHPFKESPHISLVRYTWPRDLRIRL